MAWTMQLDNYKNPSYPYLVSKQLGNVFSPLCSVIIVRMPKGKQIKHLLFWLLRTIS